MTIRGRMKKLERAKFCLGPVAAASLLMTACAGSPPSAGPGPAGPATSSDAMNVSDICAAAAQTKIASAGGDAKGIKILCQYRDSIADKDKSYFYDTAGADYTPYFGNETLGDKYTQSTEGANKVYTFSMYTGVLAKGQKPADVADVIRLQLFYPTEFKSNGFKTDAAVTYSPKNVTPGNFSSLDYDYYKNAVGNERPKLDYSSKVTFFDFGSAGIAVVDNLTAERNGSGVKDLDGVVLIYAKGGDTYVVGRSGQTVRAQQQDYAAVEKSAKDTMKEQVQRDFDNYANAAKAASIMAGKKK